VADATTLLITAGSTIIAGLGGTFLGFRLKANSDQEQWWREQKKAAYVELLTALDHFQHTAMRFEVARNVDPQSEEAQAALRESFAGVERVDAALSAVHLVLSESDGGVLDGVVTVCAAILDDVTTGQPDDNSQKALYAKVIEVRDLARRDVGISRRTR
jgi:hypothetical protein